MIQKWVAPFDGIGHRHPITLRTQQIAGHQRVRLHILIAPHRRPVSDVRRKRCLNGGIRIPRTDRLAQFTREKLPDALRRPPTRDMGEKRCVDMLRTITEVSLGKRPAGDGGIFQIGIESFENARSHQRCGNLCHEATDFRLLENIIAAKHFIGTLPGQHHLVSRSADMFRQQHHWHRRGTDDRRFDMENRAWKRGGNVGARASNGSVMGAQIRNQFFLVCAFVEFSILERERKSAQRCIGKVVDDRGNDRRIQPTAQVRANRHVGTQLQFDRVDQQRAQLVRVFLC